MYSPTIDTNDNQIGNCTCDLTPEKCDILCGCDPYCSDYLPSFPFVFPNHPNAKKTILCNETDFVRKINVPSSDFKWGSVLETQFCVQFNNNPSLGYKYKDIVLKEKLSTDEINTELDKAIKTTNLTKIANDIGDNTEHYIFGDSLRDSSEQAQFVGISPFGTCQIRRGILDFGREQTLICSQSPTTPITITDITGTFLSSITTKKGLPDPITNITARVRADSGSATNALDKVQIRFLYEMPGSIHSVDVLYGHHKDSQSLQTTIEVLWSPYVDPSGRPQPFPASGAPGYLGGWPVIASSSSSAPFAIDSADEGAMKVTATQSTGTEEHIIRFGCDMRISVEDPAVADVDSAFSFVSANGEFAAVSSFGVASVDNDDDWVPIIEGSTDCKTNGDVCVGIELQFLTENAGFSINPQPRILGVRKSYVGVSSATASAMHHFYCSVSFNTLAGQAISEVVPGPPSVFRLPEDILYPFRSAGSHHKPIQFTSLCLVIASLLTLMWNF